MMADTKHAFSMYRAPADKAPRYRGFAAIARGFGVESDAVELCGDTLEHLTVTVCRPPGKGESAAQWATRLSSEVCDEGYTPLGVETFQIDWANHLAGLVPEATLIIDWVFLDNVASAGMPDLYDAVTRSAAVLGHAMDGRLSQGPVAGGEVLLYQSPSGQTVFRDSATIGNGHFRSSPLQGAGSLSAEEGCEPLLVLAHIEQHICRGHLRVDGPFRCLRVFAWLPNNLEKQGFTVELGQWEAWLALAKLASWDEREMRQKAEALALFKPRFHTATIQSPVPSLF